MAGFFDRLRQIFRILMRTILAVLGLGSLYYGSSVALSGSAMIPNTGDVLAGAVLASAGLALAGAGVFFSGAVTGWVPQLFHNRSIKDGTDLMKVAKDIISLDIESTGVWVEKDKIIEIALIRYTPDGERQTWYKRINPGINIPRPVTELTGISNEDVKGAPSFKQVSREILEFIGDADFAGFNVERFDLPLLERECADSGLRFEWKNRRVYDAQKVFHLNEKRDLTAAYKFYCDKDLAGAHSALADSEAVLEILEKQVQKYGEGSDELSSLDKFEYNSLLDYYDSERKFCWWNGKLYLMFGKYARKQPLEELVKLDAGYLKWILTKDFSDDVKGVVQDALAGRIPVKAAVENSSMPGA